MNRRQQAGDWQKSDKSSVYLTSPQVGETDKASVIFGKSAGRRSG